MRYSSTVSHQFVQQVVSTFDAMGYSDSVLAQSLISKQHRVPLAQFLDLLEEYQQLSGDTNIGLSLGSTIEPSCFNMLGHLVISCKTVGEAMSVVQKFQKLIIDSAESDYYVVKDKLVFKWQIDDVEGHQLKLLVSLVLAATRRFGQWVTGIDEPFSAVYWQHERPNRTELCETIFGHPGFYGHKFSGFSIPLSWMERPIRCSNSNVKSLLCEQADYELSKLTRRSDFASHLFSQLYSMLGQQKITMAGVSAHMELPERRIQRYLHEQSTSFTQLLQEVRLKKANYLLMNSDLPLIEIALLLGYQEASSFSSAYKQWSGMTPREYRSKNLTRELAS